MAQFEKLTAPSQGTPIRFENGGSWILLSMALAWGSDTGGYFAGRFLGKRFPKKLAPLISPPGSAPTPSTDPLPTAEGLDIRQRVEP